MNIIPAVDLYQGMCVRLKKGRLEDLTIYSNDPVKVASGWEKAGARRLHVVDLDGAFTGAPVNKNVVCEIIRTVKIPVEIGGGIRDLETAEEYLQMGARWIIFGSAAVKNMDLLKEACEKHPGRILAGIDAKDGKVAVSGWTETSQWDAVDLALQMKRNGISEIIFTDISKDGMLQGPNLASLERMARLTGLSVIASGGISTIADLEKIKALSGLGVAGAIVGMALYEGTIDLAEAIRQIEG